MEKQWAKNGGMNWTWYLEYSILENKKVEIYVHDRLHHERDKFHPKTENIFSLVEGEKYGEQRIALFVKINGTTFEIENQKYIFDYGQFPWG